MRLVCAIVFLAAVWSGRLLAQDEDSGPTSVDRIASDVLAESQSCESNAFAPEDCRKFKNIDLKEQCSLLEESDDCYQAVIQVMEFELGDLYRQASVLTKVQWSRVPMMQKRTDMMIEPKPEQAFQYWKKFRDAECRMAFLIGHRENKVAPTPELICKVAMTYVRTRDLSVFVTAAQQKGTAKN